MRKLIIISAVWCPSCLLLNKEIKNIKNDFDIEIEKLDYDLDDIEEAFKSLNDKTQDNIKVLIKYNFLNKN